MSPVGPHVARGWLSLKPPRKREPKLEASLQGRVEGHQRKEGNQAGPGRSGDSTNTPQSRPRRGHCTQLQPRLTFTSSDEGRDAHTPVLLQGRLPDSTPGRPAQGSRKRPDPVEGDLATLAKTTNAHTLSRLAIPVGTLLPGYI